MDRTGQRTEAGGSPSAVVPPTAESAYAAAVSHLLAIQKPDGGWEGEMVWNTMILSQYVIVQHAVGRRIAPSAAGKMIQHYRVTRTADGAWGMHSESEGYVFFTALAYVALRLLGVAKEDPLLVDARRFLHRQPGGVQAIPTWGKFWLAMCGLYGYEGVNPFPPELFILPGWLPIHPVHYYCHTRYIYLAIAYLYGRRFRIDLGPLTSELRAELYTEPYESIAFAEHRHAVAQSDLYVRPSAALRALYDVLYRYEKKPLRGLRERALSYCLERILYEQRASRYQGISPVNGLLNCLALYAHSPHHPDLGPSLSGVEAWKWEDEAEGIRYCGARSNTWDTAFVVQALTSRSEPGAGRPELTQALQRAHQHLRSLQMTAELPNYQHEHRDPILGGFCFSDGHHRWAVSDCTAEAVTAILDLERSDDRGQHEVVPFAEHMPLGRIEQAARFILQRRNADGGFGTYERRRGSALLEAINPSEMYGSCMTERSYLECTASAVRALAAIRTRYGSVLSPALRHGVITGIDDGVALLRQAQRSDGSFPGFWGINFTYGIFHVVTALRKAGVPAHDAALQRAASWLLSKQKRDGGWGEHYTSCLNEQYVEHPQTQVVMTSWALLALLELVPEQRPASSSSLGEEPRSADSAACAQAIERGIRWLCAMQLPDGSFPQQAQNGVFFGTAMLDYRLYKSYFPAWALAEYSARFGAAAAAE